MYGSYIGIGNSLSFFHGVCCRDTGFRRIRQQEAKGRSVELQKQRKPYLRI
jgi:hypothetical protein